MKTLLKNVFRAATLLALVAATPVLAAGETTGRVTGYVFDPTGAALAMVPLTISGPTLQQPMERTTGDDGRYDFDNLPVGDEYVIEVNVPGFTPIKQGGIKVLLGQTTPVDVKLQVMTETQAVATYEIVEKVNPILNPDSAQAVAVIDAEKAAETPIFPQVEGMAQQAPGVGPGTRPVTRGGLARYGKFYVDGLDTTDITDGTITAPMAFDAVQNFEVITGAMDAQYNSLGVVTNAVTRSGGNKFTYDVILKASPSFMVAKPNFVASQPQTIGDYLDNPNQAAATTFYGPSVNLGGPIVKDKLWFYASYQQNFSHRENPLAYAGINENRATDTTTSLGRLKLTWQATQSDRISVAFNLDRNVINNNTNSQTFLVAPEAESKIHRGGEFFLVNYDHNFTDAVLFQLQTGVTYKQANTDPIFSDYTTPAHRVADYATYFYNTPSISTDQPGNYLHETKWRVQFDPTLSWKMRAWGTHQMKLGAQLNYLIDKQATGVSGNVRYLDRTASGVAGFCSDDTSIDPSTSPLPVGSQFCNQKITFIGNQGGSMVTDASALNMGFFLQDHWSVTRQLTITPGLRFDAGKLYGNDGKLITNLGALGPRFSVNYDLFNDRKTMLVAHYGRSNDIGNIYIAQHANPGITQVTATATNGVFPDCTPNSTLAGCTTSGGDAGKTFARGPTVPHVDELSAGVHTEIAPEAVLGVDYTYRYYGNLWSDEETNRIWDASGTRILGYADGAAHSVYNVSAPDSAYRRYNGMDVWVQGTPGRWDLLASYTLAFNKGTVTDYFDGYLGNPRQTQFYDGNLPDDRRHTVKGSVSYKTSFGLDLGARFSYATGGANWESFRVTTPDGTVTVNRSPRGTGYPISSANGLPVVDPGLWAELRNPAQMQIHLLARYNIGQAFHLKQKVEATLFVINALNDTGASSYNSQWNPSTTSPALNTFGYAGGHLSSLQGEFVIRVRN